VQIGTAVTNGIFVNPASLMFRIDSSPDCDGSPLAFAPPVVSVEPPTPPPSDCRYELAGSLPDVTWVSTDSNMLNRERAKLMTHISYFDDSGKDICYSNVWGTIGANPVSPDTRYFQENFLVSKIISPPKRYFLWYAFNGKGTFYINNRNTPVLSIDYGDYVTPVGGGKDVTDFIKNGDNEIFVKIQSHSSVNGFSYHIAES
jgi:hypothetical protein